MELQPNNPLHGKRLDTILEELEAHYGWEKLGEKFKMKCFQNNPNIKSCLVFLRRNEWARIKVERLYVFMVTKKMRKQG